MAAKHPYRSNQLENRGFSPIPDSENYSFLYLKEEELHFGLCAMFEALAALKSLGEAQRQKTDLSWAETQALILISAKSDTVLNLAARLNVTKQAFTKTLRILEKNQYVARKQDRSDKRRNLITISDTGNNCLQKLTRDMKNALARARRNAGAEAVYGSDQVLWSLIEDAKIRKHTK